MLDREKLAAIHTQHAATRARFNAGCVNYSIKSYFLIFKVCVERELFYTRYGIEFLIRSSYQVYIEFISMFIYKDTFSNVRRFYLQDEFLFNLRYVVNGTGRWIECTFVRNIIATTRTYKIELLVFQQTRKEKNKWAVKFFKFAIFDLTFNPTFLRVVATCCEKYFILFKVNMYTYISAYIYYNLYKKAHNHLSCHNHRRTNRHHRPFDETPLSPFVILVYAGRNTKRLYCAYQL